MLSFFNKKKVFSWNDFLRNFLVGFTMGSADIVPGVSGGTIAFVFGIYEELIFSIKKVSGDVLRLVFKLQFRKALEETPFHFLVPLGFGMMTAVLSLSKVISILLADYPVFIWAFFFGLIAASIIVIRKRIVVWDPQDFGVFFIAAILGFFIVGLVPVTTPATSIAYFASGAIAINAMILPGISGSFLLLILGKYEQILGAVVTRDFVTLGFVGIGAILGLAVFARILSWLFKHHHDIIVAALSGFMLGSLRKVWPWKETITTRINSHGELVPLIQQNVFPNLDTGFVVALLLGLGGFMIIYQFDRMQLIREKTEDIEDTRFAKEHKKALSAQEH